MVQGSKKLKASGGGGKAKAVKVNSHKIKKMMAKAKVARKGNPSETRRRVESGVGAIEEKELSKAIDKANEQKVAAKLLQNGGLMKTADLIAKGKELSKEQRRKQVKKKLTRVEEKLKTLKEKAEKEGTAGGV